MNTISIHFFGLLAEITGEKSLTFENVNDTDNLKEKINLMFPQLVKQQYLIAVNNCMVNNNTALNNNCKVACMPPFAGG